MLTAATRKVCIAGWLLTQVIVIRRPARDRQAGGPTVHHIAAAAKCETVENASDGASRY
jgi:hypothetical protein